MSRFVTVSSLRSWWQAQIQNSSSIQALLTRYHQLRLREQRLVLIALALCGLLLVWLVLQPAVEFVRTIDAEYKQAQQDQDVLEQALVTLNNARSADWQVINEQNIEAFLITKMTAYGVPGRLNKKESLWEVRWSGDNLLPSVLIFADYLTNSGLIVRDLRAEGKTISMSLQTQ